MGSIGFLIGVGSSTCMVFSINTIKSLAPDSHAGLAIGTGQMLLYMVVVVVQWGSGALINLFPGETPGTFRNLGFVIAFGAVVALLWLTALMTWRTRDFN
jgi:hypothetical protein